MRISRIQFFKICKPFMRLALVFNVLMLLFGGTPVKADDSSSVSVTVKASGAVSTKLVFKSPAQTVVAGEISAVMTVEIRSGGGNPVNTTTDITLDLVSSSGTGKFLPSAVLASPGIASVTIPAGSSSAQFYYWDSSDGIFTITVSESPGRGWADAAQDITINEPEIEENEPTQTPAPETPKEPGQETSGESRSTLSVDIGGSVSDVEITEDGIVMETFVINDPKQEVAISMEAGTRMILGQAGDEGDEGDNVPDRIEVIQSDVIPDVPEGFVRVSPVFDIVAYRGDIVQTISFEGFVRLAMNYDPELVPENVKSIFIAYYDSDTGWTSLEVAEGSGADVGKVAGQVKHFTLFTVLAAVTESKPDLILQNISLSNSRLKPGERLTIEAKVINKGGISGEFLITAMVSNLLNTQRMIKVSPGEEKTVTFTVIPQMPGKYTVVIGNMTSEFVVYQEGEPLDLASQRFYTWLIFFTISLAVLSVIFMFILWRRKRRAKIEGNIP